MDHLELHGRTAVITGAASGIGRALATEAAMRGMSVCISDIDEDGLAATEQDLRQRQAQVLAKVVDVRSAEAVEQFAEDCFSRFTSIGAVFANAGIIHYDDSIRPNLDFWNRIIDVNLRGPVHVVAAFLGRMVDRDQPAQFVVTGSLGSIMASPDIAAYCATKHAIWSLTQSLQIELERQSADIRVSLLAPPRVATGIVRESVERVRASQGDDAAEEFLKAMMTADDIARFTFDKVLAREFYIFPDDSFRKRLRERWRPLLEG